MICMWERFGRFAKDFVMRAQRDCIAHNARRMDGDGTAEHYVGLLRTEFARPTGPSAAGSVIVVCRSEFVPSLEIAEPAREVSDQIMALSAISAFDAEPASSLWWLVFTPGPGPEDSWAFDHADVQDASGARVHATNTAWIEALLPLRLNRKFDQGGAAEFEVDANPDGRILPSGIEALLPFYRRAAADGLPTGMFMIGVAYALGRGVEPDDAMAVHWLSRAAARGHAWSLLLLASFHAQGRGTSADAGLAVAHWPRAAGQGADRSRCLLGDLYENGFGVPQDFAFARRCHALAGANGLAAAEYRIARMHDYGLGVPKDMESSWHAYRRAAGLGHEVSLEAFEVADFDRPGYALQFHWDGELRARYAGWLRHRRSRASEASAAEALLAVAEACDAAIAAGSLSTSHVATLVDAAHNSDALLWNPTISLVIHLWRRGIDASPVVLKLIESSKAAARGVAQMSMHAKGIPPETLERVLVAGRADKSAKVRDEAIRAQRWHPDITH